MSPTTLFGSLREALQRFRSAQGGNVVVTFAFLLIPILGAVGASVDYSKANSIKAAMQAAADATALMLSKEAASLTDAQITQKGTAYFNAVFNRPQAQIVAVTSTYTAASSTMSVTASGTTIADFMSILGVPPLGISASSTVSWGGGARMEIALVLDNTGSMLENGKIGALKSASHQLLDSLQRAAANPGDVKVAIVPFTTQVNIGTAYRTATWIDWNYMKNTGGGGDNCDWDKREERGSESNWNGGVVDRLEPYNVQDTTPTSDPTTWYPAVNSSLTPLQPLTSDWTALHAKIDQMRASGKTNTTIGLVWGWHALSPSEPLTEGTAPSSPSPANKIMVFLTDGENTEDRWTTRAVNIDARTRTVCANIKAAGIKLYTVRVMDGNRTLLQNCASDSTMYYEVSNSNQLASVFGKIAGDLKSLRIAR